MALPYTVSGTLSRSAGLVAAIAKQSKILNFKPAKKIEFSFDPLRERVVSARCALSIFNQERVRDTNPNCIVKTTVVCDRSEPTIKITLVSGHKILFKTQNLETLEILKKFNELVSSEAEAEETSSTPVKGGKTKPGKRRT
ncbi:39S ribosomal protein L53, mitochondrial-like [Penaeus japonicus]|uniref:39S ribosomal protein L53, mitochondrial-like n=1 Tax=Penaeus japonicus TaxID=27405 RepID=UPI001C715E0F|nr:39S ribosomal protein L53, mitochondrial-like [Penaeus japonicus]